MDEYFEGMDVLFDRLWAMFQLNWWVSTGVIVVAIALVLVLGVVSIWREKQDESDSIALHKMQAATKYGVSVAWLGVCHVAYSNAQAAYVSNKMTQAWLMGVIAVLCLIVAIVILRRGIKESCHAACIAMRDQSR